ncbi:hypothetical protein WJ438_25820 [Streptomyces sp. GD-15H]
MTNSSSPVAVSFIRRTPRCFSSSAGLNVVIVRFVTPPAPAPPSAPASAVSAALVRSIRFIRSTTLHLLRPLHLFGDPSHIVPS